MQINIENKPNGFYIYKNEIDCVASGLVKSFVGALTPCNINFHGNP